METSRPPAERLLFLDNVRYLIILCVVIFHTAVGYSGLPEFFMEANTSSFFVYVRHLLFFFMMPTLFFVAGYFALPESAEVRVFDVGMDGELSGGRSFAEIFLADGRYGRPRSGPVESPVEEMVADREGRLYAATRFGVQVFAPEGRLLGVVHFPVPAGWRSKHPVSCVFGGEDMSTLYVACGDEVYAVRTRTEGF